MQFLFLATEAAADGDMMAMILQTVIPFALILVAFYFFLIRPENKRKKATQTMRKELIVGDEVTTIGGVVGRVVNIKDDVITIETGADRNKMNFMRWAISSKGEQITE